MKVPSLTIFLLVRFIVSGATISTASAAGILSFNVSGTSSGGMALSETAGAPGAVATNWNNLHSVQATAGSAISGSLSAGTIRDNSGMTIPTATVAWSGTGAASQGGGGTGSQKMFESEWDLFDLAGNTATSDMTITVINLPYTAYDVFFYVQDASNAATRGGNVTANGTTKSITMFNSPSNNPAGQYGYTEADSAFSWNATTTQIGSFLRIENVSGSTLTLDISSKNPSTPRLRMSGFQIVQVPELSVSMLFMIAASGTLLVRRRPLA